jgi:hypothetical protein
VPAFDVESPLPEDVAPETSERGCSPGVSGALVSRVCGCTGRPVAGAKLNRDDGVAAAAAGADSLAESEPGRASLKPIVEPATTASESHSAVRRDTI